MIKDTSGGRILVGNGSVDLVHVEFFAFSFCEASPFVSSSSNPLISWRPLSQIEGQET